MKNNNPWFEGRNPGGRSARKDIYGEKIPGWFIGRKEGFLHPKVLSNEINPPTHQPWVGTQAAGSKPFADFAKNEPGYVQRML